MIDFESLVPERCQECYMVGVLIRNEKRQLGMLAGVIEADYNDGTPVDLSRVLLLTTEFEEAAKQRVGAFLARCLDTTEDYIPLEDMPTLFCRMPPNDWKEVH